MAAVGFEPTPFRTGALNRRLRPLGHATNALSPHRAPPPPSAHSLCTTFIAPTLPLPWPCLHIHRQHQKALLTCSSGSNATQATCAQLVWRCDTLRLHALKRSTPSAPQKAHTPSGGLEPPTFRLTAERANRLRHEGSFAFRHAMPPTHCPHHPCHSLPPLGTTWHHYA